MCNRFGSFLVVHSCFGPKLRHLQALSHEFAVSLFSFLFFFLSLSFSNLHRANARDRRTGCWAWDSHWSIAFVPVVRRLVSCRDASKLISYVDVSRGSSVGSKQERPSSP